MLINLTPHIVKICDENGSIIREIPPTPPAARVGSTLVEREPIDGIPFSETIFGEVENLPAPQDGIFYIVSQIVIAACPGRTDLVRPDTGADCLRDGTVHIVAVRRLTR